MIKGPEMVSGRQQRVHASVRVGDSYAQRGRLSYSEHLRLEGNARDEARAETQHRVVVAGRLYYCR